MPLLNVVNLNVAYGDKSGGVLAVQDVSFQLDPGEFLGVVGESGSGKSTLGYAISRLLRPPGNVVGGNVYFNGRDLLSLTPKELRKSRWSEIAVVMQSGMNALNPVMTIGRHFEDTIRASAKMTTIEIRNRARELMYLVNIDDSALGRYPHELSGGMKQRVSIALALALNPQLIIFDEPTTALDVVVQRSIVQNLKNLQRTYQFAAIFISHDLGTVLEIAHRVAVMYAGRFVEVQDARKLLRDAQHPYTQSLLGCFPDPTSEVIRLIGIPGTPPDLKSPPPGCAFAPRCKRADALCHMSAPDFVYSKGIGVACHFPGEQKEVATRGRHYIKT